MPFLTFAPWLLLIWSLGWLALPLSRRVWGGPQHPAPNTQHLLPDGGIAAGRMLFLVLWTLAAFWLGHWGVAVRHGALLVFPVAIIFLLQWRRDRDVLRELLRSNRRGVIAGELIFLGVFAFFFVMRGFWPCIDNGEKPMDMALISACAHADFLPPANPYAAGERLASYYYFGHLQTALLTDAIGAQPRWTYNLMAATLPALCFSLLASLAGALTGRVRHGALVAFFVLACGTQEAWRQWFFPIQGQEAKRWMINYWDTSRVIPFWDKGEAHYLISEYPWFTFNYGDLHAHFFAQPVALLVVALGWALFHQVRGGTAKSWKLPARLAALALGAQIVTNTWDFPAYGLLIALCLGLPSGRAFSVRVAGWLGRFLAVVVLALILASPFLLKLHSEASPPQRLEQPASPLMEWLLVWGGFVVGWLFVLRDKFKGKRAPICWALTLLFVVGPWLKTGQPCYVLSLLLILIFWTLLSSLSSDDDTHVFLCRMALCGLLALLWSETTWAGFLGPPYHRQDTVFKFGLQAWYLLGTASLCGALRLWSRWRASMPEPMLRLEIARTALAIVAIAPVLCTVAVPLARGRGEIISRGRMISERETTYPPEATKPVIINLISYGLRFEKWDGWDVWSHLTPAERDAAQWLRDAARDGDGLLEAEERVGGDYTEFTRYAHATGVPGVIGPQAHTFQWGLVWDKVFERKNRAREFFSVGATMHDALRAYPVRFVVCGELERREYGPENLARLERKLIRDGWRNVTFQDRDEDPHRVTIFYRE